MTDEPDRPDKAASPERDTADSDCSRWVAEFAADLRRMHEKAQKPSLRQMSMKVPYSHTALSNALRGAGGHLPSQKLTLALVRACGGDEQAWSARWQQEHARITAHAKSRDRGLGAGEAVPSEFHVRSPFRRPGRPILLSALGVALALVIGVVFEFNHGGGSVPPTDGFGGALPICEQSGTYNSCEIQQWADRVPRGETSQQMKEFIAGFSKNPPQQSGPWPFFVYDTIVTQEDMGRLANATPADIGKDFGLHVRTTPTERAQYVGTVNLGSVVWADCYLTNNYDPGPPPSDDVGGKWLRIQWPTNLDTTAPGLSSPTDPFREYVYAGYTLPFTHNGKIPSCA
jgi:hypothetical protein